MTTQLSPVVQLLLSRTPAGKRGAAHQAEMGARALPRAATTAERPRTLSCGPWTQVRPCQLVIPTTKKQNDPWRQVLACPHTHPSSLAIPWGADVTGQLEVSNAEGSKHQGFHRSCFPSHKGWGQGLSLKELLEIWFYIWLLMAVKDDCSGQSLRNTTFLSQTKHVFWKWGWNFSYYFNSFKILRNIWENLLQKL